MNEQDLKIAFLNNRVASLTQQVFILKSYIEQRDRVEAAAGETQVDLIQQEAKNETDEG